MVVTAGGTREPLDPVRYIGNRSSGQMGYALAAAARDQGAEVTLISGPAALPPPAATSLVSVESAEEMCWAVTEASAGADMLIMAAAVADYRPRRRSEQKIKKSQSEVVLRLDPTVDILETLAGRDDLVRIGFAAETENLIDAARQKLRRKNLDMIVANDAVASIGAEQTQVTLIDGTGLAHALPRGPKSQVAIAIVDAILERFSERFQRDRR